MIWIRSQDKETIKEIKEISITELECISIDGDGYLTLGIYSTKEKALKVLDMIQERIENNTGFKRKLNYVATSNQGKEHYVYSKNVFQMPQDDEVK